MTASWIGLGLQSAGLLSSLLGGSSSNNSADVASANAAAADAARQKNLLNEGQAAAAYFDTMQPLSGLSGYTASSYTPQLVNYGSVPDPNLTQLDQADLNSRLAALKQIETEANTPGLSQGDAVLLNQSARPMANALLTANNNQDQMIRARMNGGDAGTQYLMGNQTNQNLTDGLANMGAQAFGQSYNSKLNALGNLANQYGQIQGQTQQLNQQNNALLNARDFNQYLSNQQATNNNTNAQNSAQQYNIANQQKVTGLNNANKTAENSSFNSIQSAKGGAQIQAYAPYNTALGQESAAFANQAAGYGAQANAQNSSAMSSLGGIASQFLNPNSGMSNNIGSLVNFGNPSYNNLVGGGSGFGSWVAGTGVD